ncbi:MAG: hypothetical protein HKN91_13095, partial [Acidimicrobiia bacterium]|nr:hypothetical protein [Acidimicrobiia bacterium]
MHKFVMWSAAAAIVFAFAGEVTTPLSAQSGNFGWAAAAAGDAVLIGQPANFYGPGAVYVYTSSGTNGWSESARFYAPDSILGDNFGRSIAASSGYVLVGAPNKDDGEGAVYWIQRQDDGSWSTPSRVDAPDGSESAFGADVEVTSEAAFVGSPGSDDRGAVYSLGLGAESAAGKIQPSSLAASSAFGAALSFEDNTLLVGAPGAGTAYVFRQTEEAWVEDGVLNGSAVTGRSGSGLGSAVLLHNGRAFVAAPRANGTGAVAVFERGPNGWQWTEDLLPAGDGMRAGFGTALAA